MRDIVYINHQPAGDLHRQLLRETSELERAHLLTLLHIPWHRLDSQCPTQFLPGPESLRISPKQMIKLAPKRIEERRPSPVIRDRLLLLLVLLAFRALWIPSLRRDKTPELCHVRPARVILELRIPTEEAIQRAVELGSKRGVEVFSRDAALELALEAHEFDVR